MGHPTESPPPLGLLDLRIGGQQTLNVEAIRESPLHLASSVKNCVSPGLDGRDRRYRLSVKSRGEN
ncbi:hypothetical protein [Laspinema palackyanum]|uniref:hypothetical protein n=1 Tax=Laspinema palackyanum TaxID=3231601 RepID=UPI00345CD192|nr:hypothetical protein [Laspinema sp. D2c]